MIEPTKEDLEKAESIVISLSGNYTKDVELFAVAISTAKAEQREQTAQFILGADNTLLGPQHREKLATAIRRNGKP